MKLDCLLVLSKYSNCLKSLAESVWAGHDNLGLTWSDRCHSTQLLLYRRLVDIVPILVTEESHPTKTTRNRPNWQCATHTLKSQNVNRSEPCITRSERALVGTPKR